MTNKKDVKVIEDDFKVDRSIIRHLIFSQAGSLSKALLELCMNGIDAKARTISVYFSSDMKRVTVSDDGIGFASTQEIKKLFGTFGFDHHTEVEIARNRQLGRFGLGRAQCLAFGSTLWKTNQFTMQVDLKGNATNDLPYIISEHADIQHKGCKIEIDLYTTMSIHDKRQLISELKRMAKYVSQTLLIDGMQINEAVSDVKWAKEDEDFYFKLAQSERGLSLYNKGVLVTTYGHSKFGCSGDLISKSENFSVNMARNDVLQAECKLWSKIPAFVKPFTIKKESTKITDQDRLFIVKQILNGELEYDEFKSKRLFQNSDGKYFTLKQMLTHAQGKITMAPDMFSQGKGTSLHRKKIAFCLSYKFADSHGFNELNDFFEELKSYPLHIHDRSVKLENVEVLNFKDASETVSDLHDIIPDDDLTKIDKARLIAARSMYQELLSQFIRAEIKSGRYVSEHRHSIHEKAAEELQRNVCFGKSEAADAWTDGNIYIALNIEKVRRAFNDGLNGLFHLMTLILHEMCHEKSTMGSHDHDADFFEKFHDNMTDDYIHLFTIAGKGLDTYINENRKIGRKLSEIEVRNTFRTLERLYQKVQ